MSYFSPATDPKLYRCSCGRLECDAPAPSSVLLMTLELMRHQLGREITVHSGPRCAFWNEKEGGEPTSAHLTGDAADLACGSGAERWDMLDAARQAGFQRLGIGRTFLHVDVSNTLPGKVVWHYYPKGATA